VIAVPVIMLLLGACAGVAIASLQSRADTSRRAQVEIGSLRFTVQDLRSAAFSASPQAGGSPAIAHAQIRSDEVVIGSDMGQLMAWSPPQPLTWLGAQWTSLYPLIASIYQIGAYGGGYNGPKAAEVNRLRGTVSAEEAQIDARLSAASTVYAHRADSAETSATAGTLVTISLLLAVFGLFYLRLVRARHAAEALAGENTRLLAQSQDDALTDALTGLPNRRALMADLTSELGAGRREVTLGLYDLDGFKAYNDTFGHAAGDALEPGHGPRDVLGPGFVGAR
jgi:hypothetical protein